MTQVNAAAASMLWQGARLRVIAGRVAFLLALLAAWELAAISGVFSTTLFPQPFEVMHALVIQLGSGEVLSALGLFLAQSGAAFAIGASVGVLIGLILGVSGLMYRSFHPIIVTLAGTPKLIFLPLIVVLSGIGSTAKIEYGAYSATLYAAVYVTAGFRSTDRRLLRLARSYGASVWQQFWRFLLPGARPSIALGIWSALTHAYSAVLVAELYVSAAGLGPLLEKYEGSLQTDNIYAIGLIIALIAAGVSQIWWYIDRRLSRWQNTEDDAI